MTELKMGVTTVKSRVKTLERSWEWTAEDAMYKTMKVAKNVDTKAKRAEHEEKAFDLLDPEGTLSTANTI